MKKAKKSTKISKIEEINVDEWVREYIDKVRPWINCWILNMNRNSKDIHGCNHIEFSGWGGGKRSRLLENGYELTLKYIKNMFQ